MKHVGVTYSVNKVVVYWYTRHLPVFIWYNLKDVGAGNKLDSITRTSAKGK
jgi:hypothetical protein